MPITTAAMQKSALEKYEEAIKDYDEAIALNPKDADAYYNRGNAKSKLGEHMKKRLKIMTRLLR